MTDLTLPVRLDPHSAPDETLHVTASGRPVRIYATDGSEPAPIHGAIYIDGRWEPRTWLAGGKYDRSRSEHAFDLRDRPKAKRGWWIGVYTKGEQRFAASFPSERDALIYNAGEGWKHFAVTYLKEGDGLDTPADPPLWVDWSRLPEWAKWAAADEDGEVWGFDKKPEEGQASWFVGANYRCAEISSSLYRLAPGFDWRETLIQRPEDV